MTDRSGTTETPEVLLARAGWMRVGEAINAGLCHDLGNRAASIEGLLQLAECGDDDIMADVEDEIRRLGELRGWFRSLSGDLDAPREPMMVPDVLHRIAPLHARRRGLEVVERHYEVQEGVLPVLANPARLSRALLVLLDRITEHALEADVRDVQVAVTGDPDSVTVTIRAEGTASPTIPADTLEALTALGAGTPGWSVGCEGGTAHLTLASLPRARAMEGEG